MLFERKKKKTIRDFIIGKNDFPDMGPSPIEFENDIDDLLNKRRKIGKKKLF